MSKNKENKEHLDLIKEIIERLELELIIQDGSYNVMNELYLTAAIGSLKNIK